MLEKKKYLVLGLARSGLAALEWLSAKGADAFGWDDGEEKRQEAAQKGFHVLSSPVLSPEEWASFEALIQSPGVPFGPPYSEKCHALTAAARSHGVKVITDLNLLREAFASSIFAGITGTNGKSTTASLVHHVLEKSAHETALGGNIGRAALDLPPLSSEGTYVLELSSFQLALSKPLRLDVAGWLNLSEDHLDVHGTFKMYSEAKGRALSLNPLPYQGNQEITQGIVMGIEDPFSFQICQRLLEHTDNVITPVAVQDPQARAYAAQNHGVTVEEGILRDWRLLIDIKLTDCPALWGVHNHQNAAVAYGMLRALGLAPETIRTYFLTFPGLVHRQERVREIILPSQSVVSFVNDSKATNPRATLRAFEAFLGEFDYFYWIAGGVAKAEGITPLAPYFSKISHSYLIGRAKNDFAKVLQDQTPHTCLETLSEAVDAAYKKACKDLEGKGRRGLILLSPACASFDQFKDYEERGDIFKKIVQNL